MERKLFLSLPSAGVEVFFDFNARQWGVNRTPTGDKDGFFVSDAFDCSMMEMAMLVGDMETAHAFLKAFSVKKREDLVDLPCIPYDAPGWDFLSWGSNPAKVCQFKPWGMRVVYDEEETTRFDLDSTKRVVLHMLETYGNLPEFVKAAIANNYEQVYTLTFMADKTGHCVRWSSDTDVWEPYAEEPTGIPMRTHFGVTAYISGEGLPLTETLMSLGFDLLAKSVAADFPVDMLITVPETAFTLPEPTNMFEECLSLDTNIRRLVFFLNGETYEEPAPAPAPIEAKEVTLKEVPLPDIVFVQDSSEGTSISCGGSVLVTGGSGEYSMERILERVREAVNSYVEFASTFSEVHVGTTAMNEFLEEFGSIRSPHEPSPADVNFPVQLTLDWETFGWDGGRFTPIYGDQAVYPNEMYAPYEMMFRYIPKTVVMSPATWSLFVAAFISTFQTDVPGLAALYYSNHDMPEDEGVSEDCTIRMIDAVTMHEAIYLWNGEWAVEPITGYTKDGHKQQCDILVQTAGNGRISSVELAKMLAGAYTAFETMSNLRLENRDKISADTIYGSWDIIETCITPEMSRPNVNISSLGSATPTYPISLYRSKECLIYTNRGWTATTPVKGAVQRLPQPVGTYKVGYTKGSVPIDEALQKLLADFITVCSDYTQEHIRTMYMLAVAKL